jgi:hypothetical protein
VIAGFDSSWIFDPGSLLLTGNFYLDLGKFVTKFTNLPDIGLIGGVLMVTEVCVSID